MKWKFTYQQHFFLMDVISALVSEMVLQSILNNENFCHKSLYIFRFDLRLKHYFFYSPQQAVLSVHA